MSLFSTIFNEALYRPLFNALILFYDWFPVHDFGLAIIALTILVRLILYPLVSKQFASQKALSELQPQIAELKKKYPKKEEQTQKMMELYKEKGIHPASGCFPLLIQLPILFALYRALYNGLNGSALASLYSFVPKPESINHIAFGFLDLSTPNVVLAVLAGALQYFQTKLMLPKVRKAPSEKKGNEMDIAEMMNTQSLYIMPIFTVIIALRFPAGLSLYWVVTTIFGIVQQILIMKQHGKPHSPNK